MSRKTLKSGNKIITLNGKILSMDKNLEFKGKLRVTVSGGDFGLLNEGVHIVELDTIDNTPTNIEYKFTSGQFTGNYEGSRFFLRNHDTANNNTIIEFRARNSITEPLGNYTFTTNTTTTFTSAMDQFYSYIRSTNAETGKFSDYLFKSYSLSNGITLTLERYLE
jgi:hypothetical protein